MQILNLRAARGWSLSQTARVFLLSDLTIHYWMQRLDEQGENALIQLGGFLSESILIGDIPQENGDSSRIKEPSPHSTVYRHGRCSRREA